MMKFPFPTGSRRLRLAAACLVVSAAGFSLQAADLYILPDGAGTKDGSSWENAQAGDAASFQAAWDALTPGDTLHVGSGTYSEISIGATKGGAPKQPVRLVGEDRGGGLPKFVSSFDKNNPGKTGGTFCRAAPGTSWFTLEGLRLENYQTGFKLNGKNNNIRIAKIEMESFREGIRSESSPAIPVTADWCHTVVVEDCRFVNFTKRAVRLQGGNFNWIVRRCYADAGGKEWFTEPFALCFQVVGDDVKRDAKLDGAHDHHITFVECVALNTYHSKSGGYWNGDGFCAERGTHNLRYERCYAAGHTDAGWDDKSVAPVLVDCIAVDNKRNYRFWGEGVKLINCVSAFAYKRGGSGNATSLWTSGSVDGEFCTFFHDDGPPISLEKEKPGAKVSAKNSVIVTGWKIEDLTKNRGIRLSNTAVISKDDIARDPKHDPRIAAERSTERSVGPKAFDNGKFGTSKGFSSSRLTKATP
jgi:hypothetical protein